MKTSRKPASRLSLLFGVAVAAAALSVLLAQPGFGSVAPDPTSYLDQQTVSGNISAKLALKHKLEQEQAAAAAAPRGPKGPAPRLHVAAVPPETWPTGIFDGKQAPVSTAEYTLENQWQGSDQVNHLNVYAGALTEDTAQGILLLVRTSPDLQTRAAQELRTPGKTGALRIVAADGLRLTVSAPTGARYSFDVATGSLTAI